MAYFTVLWKTLFFYFLIMMIYRIMGKREVGELSIMDLIVSIFIAELAAISIDNYQENVFISIVPIIVLVVIQLVISRVSLKNSTIRSVLDGDPSMIIERGKVNFKEMLKQRYNLDDLLVQLRNRGIKSIGEVDYAILETSGKLSVFKKDDDKNRVYPLPIIVDGKIQKNTLYKIGKDCTWLHKILREQNYQLEDVFYGFYQKNKLFLIEKEAFK